MHNHAVNRITVRVLHNCTKYCFVNNIYCLYLEPNLKYIELKSFNMTRKKFKNILNPF